VNPLSVLRELVAALEATNKCRHCVPTKDAPCGEHAAQVAKALARAKDLVKDDAKGKPS